MDAATELVELDAKRAEASRRVDELEQAQRDAGAAVQDAAGALSEVERRGGKPQERREAEANLAKARQSVDDPALPAQVEGAKARVRDLHAERQRFIAENLAELVTGPEQDAAVAVEAMLAAASVFLDAYARREQAATVIGQLASAAGHLRRGDVGPATRAEAAARELTRLIEQGEPSPTLLVYPVGDVPEAVPA